MFHARSHGDTMDVFEECVRAFHFACVYPGKNQLTPGASRHVENHGDSKTPMRTTPGYGRPLHSPGTGPLPMTIFPLKWSRYTSSIIFLHSSSPAFFLRVREKTLTFWGSWDARSAQGISFRQGKSMHSEQNTTLFSLAHRKVAHWPSMTGQNPSIARHPGQEAFSIGIVNSCATRDRTASSVPARKR